VKVPVVILFVQLIHFAEILPAIPKIDPAPLEFSDWSIVQDHGNSLPGDL
jgi:hypothetical protein